MTKTNVITGALSYTGRYISKILLQKGETVRGLTNHPNRKFTDSQILDEVNSIKDQIHFYPMDLDNISTLRTALKGADTLYFTYWVRFNDYAGISRDQVLQRATNLIEAAIQKNIQKIVFTSHTNTSLDSPYPYILGKAKVEAMIKQSGISYGFARPCVIYGDTPSESILINNLAYLLKKFPLILIPSQGTQIVQPIHVQELANLCVELAETQENKDIDAVGPKLTYLELIQAIQKTIKSKNFFLKGVPADICYYALKPVDWILQDIILDKDDLYFLNDGLLESKNPDHYGQIDIRDWLKGKEDRLGQQYLNSTNIYYKK